LNSSHDLFNFEFRVTEDYQTINVSLKNEIWRYEGNIPDVDGCGIWFKAYFSGQGLVHLKDPIGTMPSKEPSSTSIVHSQSSNRIISEGRNHREKMVISCRHCLLRRLIANSMMQLKVLIMKRVRKWKHLTVER
jgi:hypothetical protein